jgi:hypothetical protein
MGRPFRTLTAAQRAEVETLAALLNQDQIADYLGMSRSTFRGLCGRDEELAVRYKRGKAKAIAHVANGLLMKARNGDTTSAIFYLKTQAGWRETERHEHALAGSSDIDGFSNDDLEAILDASHSRRPIRPEPIRIGVPRETGR